MEKIKIAVALRAARTALGWSQQEFADHMQAAKSTVARIETLEMDPKAEFLNRALWQFRERGVSVDLIHPEKIVITIGNEALTEAQSRLDDDQMRRADRKTNVELEPRPTAQLVSPRKKK